MGLVLLCGSAAFLSLDALVHLLHVKEAIDLLDVVLHLALDPNEADRREISQAVVLLVEGTGDAEFLGDFVLLGGHLYSNVRLVDGVAVDFYLHFGLEEVAIGFITNRLCFNSILMLNLINLQDLLKFFESYLILLAQSDLFLDKLHHFFLDEVFLEVLLLQLLHEQIAVFHFNVHLLHLPPHHRRLLSYLLVLVEQLVGLGLEVIQLVAQFPDLVLSVFLRNRFVQLLHDLPRLLPHLLDLVLNQGKHLVLMVLKPTHDVVVYRVDDVMYLLKVGSDRLFRLFQGGLAQFDFLDVGQKCLSDGVFDESVDVGQASPAD